MPYKDPEQAKRRKKELYEKNPEKYRSKQREYYNKTKKERQAYDKMRYKRDRAKRIKLATEINARWRAKNPDLNRARRMERWKAKRYEMFNLLGGAVCVHCGYDDWRALQIDHINGGGCKEIRSFNNTKNYYDFIKKNLEKYQILCANCNRVKVHVEKEHWRRQLKGVDYGS